MIAPTMASPIGHALAGLTAAWAVDLVPGKRAWRTAPKTARWLQQAGGALTLACVALAAAADLDLLFVNHRTATHSLGAVILVAAGGAALAARAGRPVARIASMCAAAYASHLLIDWLAVDLSQPRGIQALWPFRFDWFISGLDLFQQTERSHLWTIATIVKNLKAIVQELVIFGPLIVALWLVREEALARLPPEMASCDHAPQ